MRSATVSSAGVRATFRSTVSRSAQAATRRFPALTPTARAGVAPLVSARAVSSTLLARFPELAQQTTAKPQPEMFCFQCEQTEGGHGCETVGVCGKTPETAALQDLLIHQIKGMSRYVSRLHEMGVHDEEIDQFILKGLFSTLTNVNFDSDRFVQYCRDASRLVQKAEQLYRESGGKDSIDSSQYVVSQTASADELEQMAHDGEASVWKRRMEYGPDIGGLVELITYGIKGTAAYHEHSLEITGKTDPEVMKAITHALDAVAVEPEGGFNAGDLTGVALAVGKANLQVMAGLEAAHIARFGSPRPQKVNIMPEKGKCILISGHDMPDLETLLKQTEGKGINVYTHGEMLPGHGYPELKKYPHLKGNYGGAWQLQKFDFAAFPGPIIMTSNCLIEPRKSYKDRVWTRSSVGWPGVKHLADRDFSAVVEQALSLPGFEKDSAVKRTVTTGYGKDAVLAAAPAVVEAVKAGNLKHFFFIGGCDGAEGERNYFKELALQTPAESMILTAGCGKYRFNKHDLGTIPGDSGLPRLVDMGQCNDSYGAVVVALALKDAFGVESVNDLPLSFAVSWFEQKAVAVLLTLLHLGVRNIHLGPNLPAFVSPAVLDVLVQTFALKPTNSNVAGDLHQMLAGEK